VDRVKGLALKRYEDTLDALFCAYLAWHCWRWGKARNECFGDLAHGYIVVPKAAT
jgi:predicted RNase H-like nuclease